MNNAIKRLLALLLVLALLPCAALSEEYRMPVADDALDAAEGLDPNVINILLIGTDTRLDEDPAGRADTMMVCSLNKTNGVVRITSLQRDSWVTIGDNGHQNKLNAAHTFGGPNLLMQTINREFGLNITKYVAVNFYGICDIVDALGGVTVQLEDDEAGTINHTVEAKYGKVRPEWIPDDATEATLCGSQALAYARIRKLDSDFGRTARQRKLLYAMAQRLTECSIPELIKTATTCFSFVKTNIGLMDAIELATAILKVGVRDIGMQAAPAEDEIRYDRSDGVSKLIYDKEQITQKIHNFIYH